MVKVMINLCIRPYAEQLLNFVMEHEDLYPVIYTASPYEYAATILPLLVPPERTACSGDSKRVKSHSSDSSSNENTPKSSENLLDTRQYRTVDSNCFLLCREDCISTQYDKVLIKNLKIFKGSSLENSLIVDNSMYCYAKEMKNGLKIKSWYGKEIDDDELRKLKRVLENWSKGVDVLKDHRNLIECLVDCLEDGVEKIDALKKVVKMFGTRSNDLNTVE